MMHCWARYLFVAVVAVLGLGQMITACGQKGDLYLPEPEPAQEQPEPAGESDGVPPADTAPEAAGRNGA